MNPESPKISVYRSLLDISKNMLESARSEQWETFIDFELQQTQRINFLKEQENKKIDSAEDRSAIISLIREIIALDAITKSLVEARSKELTSLLASNKSSQKLQGAYGASHLF